MKRISVVGLLLVALLYAPVLRSQQSSTDQAGSTPATPDQPLPAPGDTSSSSTSDSGAVPAAHALFGTEGGDSSQAASQPEMSPLSGAEQLTIPGTQPANYFDASALFSGSGDSGVLNSQGMPTWGANEVAGGQVMYDRSWNADRFSVGYSGGGVFYQPSAQYPASMYQTLSLAQILSWKRLTLRLLDNFSYSPNSSFGGAGTGGPGLLAEEGPTSTALSPIYGASDTILTGQTRVINNSAVGEIQYNLSRRSSFTVTGSYAVLEYLGGGFISSRDYVVSGGYNYMLTAKDTLDVTYSLTQTNYTGTPENSSFQQVNLGYAHQLNDRLVFQISGGPEWIVFRDYSPSAGNELTWSLNTGLQYRLRRSALGASFSRGANAGSGVFFGSIGDSASANVSHQFSRFLIGAVNVGYSLNKSLASTAEVANEYHNWFVGASLGRQLGRYMHLSFNYGAEQQPNGGICPVASCGLNSVVQTIGVSVDLHVRPLGALE
jgi:hypothetical protein